MESRSLSQGWRADLNTSALGYFRTDDETTARILSHLSSPVLEEGQALPLLDPCCGEGIALSAAQRHFPGSKSFGIELDTQRFFAASKVLDVVLHGDAVEDHWGSAQWASCLWFNPPYDDVETPDGGNTRLEYLFWRPFADRLIKGGMLVAILPTQLFLRFPQMCSMLAHYLDERARVYRAATDKFNQLVIIGPRRSDRNMDTILQQTLLAVSEGKAEVPVIPHLDRPIFSLPVGKEPLNFQMNTLTEEALSLFFEKEAENDRLFFEQIGKTFVTAEDRQRQRSVMPLREGHIPAVLASGLLDGFVSDEQGTFLVKGSSRRVAEHWNEDKSSESQERRVSITVHTNKTACFAWDVQRKSLVEVS